MPRERRHARRGWPDISPTAPARRALEPTWHCVVAAGRRVDNAEVEASTASTRRGGPGKPALSPRLLRLASDDRLVALSRAGVGAGVEAIYDRHHAQILSFCHHMLGSHEE